MQLAHRVVLVTGGAQRVGRVIAHTLARRGADIVISYRTSATAARETVAALRRNGVRAEAIRADLSKATQVQQLIQRITKQFGRLDMLVNNAAVFERTPFSALTERQWDHHLDSNLKGPFLCALYASRAMRRQGAGKIINIADWAGERPYRDYLPYCISKAGVLALTKALAKELAPHIQVVSIAPGPMLPPPGMSRQARRQAIARLPLQRWGSPDDVAKAVVFAIEGTDFITGSTIYVDGGRSIT